MRNIRSCVYRNKSRRSGLPLFAQPIMEGVQLDLLLFTKSLHGLSAGLLLIYESIHSFLLCHLLIFDKTKNQMLYRQYAVSGRDTLHRPDLFSAACPLSASTGPLNLAEIERYGGKDEEGNISAEQKEAWFKKYSVVKMVQNLPEKDLKSVRWYIDCGDDDFLYEGNALAHIHLRKRDIPHEYRVRDGGHNWTYWRESLPEVLRFVSEGFHQH